MKSVTSILKEVKDVINAPDPTFLDEMIDNACRNQHEPDLALNLEIIDIIKQRKNGPREAALAIVRNVNYRLDPKTPLIALELLEMCVKNLGYPFHLQIASKEFLNGLCKRFPETPDTTKNKILQKILYMIHLWTQTLCLSTKYKDDLVNINEMYRILGYRGYMFPELKQDDIQSIMPISEGFLTQDEIEQGDRAILGAKLDELLRRGTAKDLEEANVIMKKMSGYVMEERKDYRKIFEKDLETIQNSAMVLNALIESRPSGLDITSDPSIQEALSKCKIALPKIEKMLSEENEEETTNKLLQANDAIQAALNNYDKYKGITNIANK
ncbi:VHS-domain-containing protein [Rozella allomycis CSF55]|uniref:VHS-domain-containing protein n=1 Tax=Rozella allomycis (strain CSF55) TaxID=988480 RepID=A0A4P9YJP2_ROZAC|nr:VHS-domain-containing protein [Rozella allomycis CSF55]